MSTGSPHAGRRGQRATGASTLRTGGTESCQRLAWKSGLGSGKDLGWVRKVENMMLKISVEWGDDGIYHLLGGAVSGLVFLGLIMGFWAP